MPVLMDANMFFSYVSDDGDGNDVDVTSVLDVQLGTQIEPLISPEIQTEIGRKKDTAHKTLMSERAQAFPPLAVDDNEARKLAGKILTELGFSNPRSQHVSDAMHVAYASLAGIELLVTRDERLLKPKSQTIADRYGVKVVSLGELVRVVDSTDHSGRYSPAALQGTSVQTVEVTDTPASVARQHQSFAMAEPKGSFFRSLESLLIDPAASTVEQIIDSEETPIGLLGYTIFSNRMRISLLRAKHDKLGHTVARILVAELRLRAREAKVNSIEVTDGYIANYVRDALELDGFTRQTDDIYAALCSSVTTAPEDLLATIIATERENSWNLERLRDSLKSPELQESLLTTEYACRPTLIDAEEIDTYMIPIDSVWAYELLGSGDPTLFSRKQELGLGAEHVYYRTPSGTTPSSPSRILWYRTDKGVEPGALVAYSCLKAVGLYKPKDAHHRFSRLGIFSLENIERQANGDGIQVLEFYGTIPIERPVYLPELNELADASGTNIFFQGPWKLPTPFKSRLLYRINGGI